MQSRGLMRIASGDKRLSSIFIYILLSRERMCLKGTGWRQTGIREHPSLGAYLLESEDQAGG